MTSVARWLLVAVVAVAAAVPGYTLRVLPGVPLGFGKINLEDILVAGAVLAALPAIVRGIRGGPRELRWVAAFSAYMIVPFFVGLGDPGGVWYAVRELRVLAIYPLAIAFATAGFGVRDFQRLAAVYVVAACAASAAVLLDLTRVIALPGYPPDTGFAARYLDWTVPIVALTLALGGALGSDTARSRLAWASALPFVGWYLIAMQERTTQGLALVITVVLLSLPRFGALSVRRVIGLGALVAALFALNAGLVPGPAWLTGPTRQMIGHWSRVLTDGSMRQRGSEFQTGMPRFVTHPVFGIGLGGAIADRAPDGSADYPWRYISSGYGVLLIKTGVVGLGLFVGMAASAFLAAGRRLRQVSDDPARLHLSLAAVGLAVCLALNLVYPVVVTPEGVVALSLFFAMLVSPGEWSGAGRRTYGARP